MPTPQMLEAVNVNVQSATTKVVKQYADGVLFTLSEVGGMLRCSPRELQRAMARGELQYCKIGRLTRISARQLRRYVEFLETGAA